MLSLDDVAATMRERFTESRGAPVTLTAEEWNAMARGIYARDCVRNLLDDPASAGHRERARRFLAGEPLPPAPRARAPRPAKGR